MISLCLVIRVEAEITKCGVAQQSAGVCFCWWVAIGICVCEKAIWTRLQMKLHKVSTQGSKWRIKYKL